MTRIERRVVIRGREDLTAARQSGRELARELGFGIGDQTRLATAISELVRNVLQFAGQGECRLLGERDTLERRLRVEVEDAGPGISDLRLAMQDGWSSRGGLGAGLPGTRRLVDEFSIESQVGRTLVRIGLVRRLP